MAVVNGSSKLNGTGWFLIRFRSLTNQNLSGDFCRWHDFIYKMLGETETGFVIEAKEMIGKYRLRKVIGTGSTCIVLEGQDQNSGEMVAVKVMSKYDMESRGILSKIQREISVIQKLDHENIVQCLDVITDGDLIYVVLEYCDDGDVLSWIMNNRIRGVDQARSIFYQIVQGVRYLHESGIAHGDLKPENVMINMDGTVKLTDFGYCHISRWAGNDEKSGTLFYASPELLINGFFDTYKSDIWALGVLLFTMVTGQFPYPEGDEKQTAKYIVKAKITYPVYMNYEAKAFIQKMLQKSPTSRPNIHELIEDEFFRESGYTEIKMNRSRSALEIAMESCSEDDLNGMSS